MQKQEMKKVQNDIDARTSALGLNGTKERVPSQHVITGFIDNLLIRYGMRPSEITCPCSSTCRLSKRQID